LAKPTESPIVVVELIRDSIHVVRKQPVLLDVDLAALYNVETRVLLQAVKRNMGRFPEDFMLQLTVDEWESLRSQIVISNVGHGGRRYMPFAFTEQGVAMLSSVLNSPRAIAVNIEIMRTFVHMRGGSCASDEFKTKVNRRSEACETVIAGVMKDMGELKNAVETRAPGPSSPEDKDTER
jgi:hypothetical protein